MLFYTLVGSYVLTSLILFKYPTLIRKKHKIKFLCRHISHRGGAGEAYENTMGAFRRAISIGTEMLEIDCHLTKDGQVVISHDQNLSRCTGVNINISQINFKDMPLLKQKLPIDFDPGLEFCGSEAEEDRKFVLLKDVFEAFPSIPINIDIKVNDDDLIKKVSNLITQYNREDYTVWGNFSNEVTKKCYETNPNVHLLFSIKRVVLLMAFMYTGLLPFVPIKETHLEIFLPSIYLNRTNWRTQGGMIPLNRFFLKAVNILMIRPSLFKHLQARGIHVYFWVLNREEEYKEAFDLGATGVMTDYPTKLKLFLNENNITSEMSD